MILRKISKIISFFFKISTIDDDSNIYGFTLDTVIKKKSLEATSFHQIKRRKYTKNERFSLEQTDLVHAFIYIYIAAFTTRFRCTAFSSPPNCSVSASYLAIVSSLIVARRAVFAMTVATETASGCVTNAAAFPARRFSFVIYPFGIVHVAVRFESCSLRLN